MVAVLFGLGLNTFGLQMYLRYLSNLLLRVYQKGTQTRDTQRQEGTKEQKESFNDKVMSKVHSPNIQNASNKKVGKGKSGEKIK